MKKLVLMAALVLGTSAAFAGDSDALKAIKKAKTYEDAAALVQSSLASLASDAEKATAYNKLVELAMEKYTKEQNTIMSNQQAELMKQKTSPVDMDGMYAAAYNAVKAGIECDKYDQLPNEKGKVAPKYAEKNAQRLWPAAMQLVNGGQEAARAENDDLTLKYWGGYVDFDQAPLFKNSDRTGQDAFIGQVAYFASRYAQKAKQYDAALRYAEVAMKDPEMAKDAFRVKIDLLRQDLTTRADSLGYAKKLEDLLEADPTNQILIENLYNVYSSIGEKEKAFSVLDKVLASDPNNFVALADKAIAYMNDQKIDDAIVYFKKALAVNQENAAVHAYYANCLRFKAQESLDGQDKNLLEEARGHFDKAKELDPDKIQYNWGYNRYTTYVLLYGEDDPRTIQADEDRK